ncbi:threonine synthase [Planotetraspora phitsanulokensis]|uniref:Threonine synthase n=1 Tax=Planotetraspora phitsanulokensis TaxID=575192 RepID=A0A8J3XIT5_9ACTN|nr:threonine synthase [Planotetraspora phitsanulokensis]GII41271.1 threonine synthase [Planotetraspora phitsanulokensis]
MGFSHLSNLECGRCGAEHDSERPQNLCTRCGSPLLARYDLTAVRASVRPEEFARRSPDLWRYHELLPVRSPQTVTTLGEGMTPLSPMTRYGERIGLPRLLMKDEGLIPTGSFKARGAAVGVSRAAELGVERLAIPTNGNAGAAWALYGARAGLTTTIVMPVDAPEITRRECVASGADLHLVDGLISDAGRIVGEVVAASEGRVFDASTLKEPYRIEGKKTMMLEIAEQLGWRTPDVILYPTGGGVGLIGIHKALGELRELGWISGPPPRLVAVQAEGCAPIVRAFEQGERESRYWEGARTVAFGINVPKPLGDFLILDALAETSGTAVTVTDDELLAELREVAAAEGAFVCPEGAAAFAAARKLRRSGWIDPTEQVVVLNTGAGIKYPGTVPVDAPVLAADGRLV